MNKNIWVFLILLVAFKSHAQLNPANTPDFFHEDVVPRIDIFVNPDDLNILLNDLSSDKEYKAKFVYNNFKDEPDTVNDVGFRIRGNVSRNDDKKSFKVSMNTFVPGRKFMGLEKIDLKATGDNSFVRPKLCWHLFREMGVTSIWLNHVVLYINNELWGVYTNVEHIDEVFVKNRFGNNNGNLYKCRYSSTLEYLGDDQNKYKAEEQYYLERMIRHYELKTNTSDDDYSDLIELTKVLANYEDENFKQMIADKIEINNLLKFFALEVYLAHWDSYSLSGNNYYLYKNTATNKFEFISYDMDLTMGILFNYGDATSLDIYNYWRKESLSPLRSRVLAVPEYRDAYSFYMRRLINQFPPDTLRRLASKIQHFIAPSVEQDPFYEFSISELYSTLDHMLGISPMGISEYFNMRYQSILEQIDNKNISPIISNVGYNDSYIHNPLKITCTIDDDDNKASVYLYYQLDTNQYTRKAMTLVYEDTLLGVANYETVLEPIEKTGLLHFYIEATDVNAQTTRSPFSNNYSITLYSTNTNLKINEILASNSTCMTDEFGEHEDWIEIINADSVPVSLGNKYLSDSYSNSDEWKLPDIVLQPGEVTWFWADDEPNQGTNHASFKLSKDGETIYLFEKKDESFILIDSLNYPELKKNESYGLLPGENKAGKLNLITPGFANDTRGLAYMTFDANMKYMIDNRKFRITSNTVDVIGNFNNWNGSEIFFDANKDSTYTRTIYGLSANETLEYRFRINRDNNLEEFHSTPGAAGHRFYTLQEGCNTQSHYFNDEILHSNNVSAANNIVIYPNPVSEQIQLQSAQLIDVVSIVDINGKNILNMNGINKNSLNINTDNWGAGIYFVKIFTQTNSFYIEKIIKL